MKKGIVIFLVMTCMLLQQCLIVNAKDDDYTRAELADDLMDAYEYITQEFSVPTVEREVFEDIKPPYGMRIIQAYIEGFMNGIDEKTFAPEQQVTNMQVMTVVYRLIEKLNEKYDTVWPKSISIDNEELSDLPDWSKEEIRYLLEREIISSEENGYYNEQADQNDVDEILNQIKGRYNISYSGERIDFNEFLERNQKL